MKEKLRRFMIGRYGVDHLGRFLNTTALVFLALGILFLPQLSSVALALLIFSYFRIFSRNTYKRAQENTDFLRIWGKIKGWFSIRWQQFRQRKTHRYLQCPSCRQPVRVPRGKGKILITCPKCRHAFTARS